MSCKQDMSESANMGVKEMAQYLGIGITNAYNLTRKKDFPAAFKIGGKVLINRNRLDEWINQKIQERMQSMTLIE